MLNALLSRKLSQKKPKVVYVAKQVVYSAIWVVYAAKKVVALDLTYFQISLSAFMGGTKANARCLVALPWL